MLPFGEPMNRRSWLLIGLAIAAAAFLAILASPRAEAWQSGDSYSGSGDWVIDDPTIVAEEYIEVTGSIDIKSSLTVYNSEIVIDQSSDGQYTVNVASTGKLLFYDSYLYSYDSYDYKFTVYGSLHINYSEIYDMWGDTSSWVGGIQLHSSSSATIENSYIAYGKTGGIYINKCSPTIQYNYIYYNGLGGSTSYAYGIYAYSDGNTSATIIYNDIGYNYYQSGSAMYGYGIRSEYQSSSDVIAYNSIYYNGFSTSTTPYGYQIYLYYSSPSMKYNDLYYGQYQLYADNSNPPTITGGAMYSYVRGTTCYHAYATASALSLDSVSFSYDSFASSFYGIYATTNSKITLKSCTFQYSISASYTRYNVYASSSTPVEIDGCSFNNYYGSSYYNVYASSYCPVTIKNSNFYNYYGSTYYGVYATSYCPVRVENSYFYLYMSTSSPSFIYTSTYSPVAISGTKFEAYATNWPGSNFFYGASYSQYSLDNSSVSIRMASPTSSYTYYVFQIRTTSALYLNYSSLTFTSDTWSSSSSPYIYLLYVYNSGVSAGQTLYLDHTSILYNQPNNYPRSSSYNYIIYTYYTPITIRYTKITDLNDQFYYTYFMYAYYSQRIVFDNADINIHKPRTYSTSYSYIYSYIYGSTSYLTDIFISNSTLIFNNTSPYSVHVYPYSYWYNYYCGHLSLNDSRLEMYAGYYVYFYNYGYSGAAGKILCLINSTIIARNTHYYPQAYTNPYVYLYFYYFNHAYIERFTLDARIGYYMYFYVYAYYSAQNAYCSMRNSTFNIDAKDSCYPSYWYCYPYMYCPYYFVYADVDRCTWNVNSSYYSMNYFYGYSGANTYLNLTNCVFNINAIYGSYAPYYYGYAYVYCYYWRNAFINNNTYNMNSTYYIYVYQYGYSGANTNLVCTNNTYNLKTFFPGVTYYGYAMVYHYYYQNLLVENNVYNVHSGYYFYGYYYYCTNALIRNNVYNLKQSVPVYGSLYGYPFYFGGSGMSYKYLLQNSTINYELYGTSSSGYPYVFYCYNCDVRVENVSIKIRNYQGDTPCMLFYTYYGSEVKAYNVSLDAEFGTDSTGGVSPGFNLNYIYNSGSRYPPTTLNITNCNWSVKLANDAFVHNGFHVVGTNKELNIVNSTLKWDISSPNTEFRLIRLYDDPSMPGQLDRLSVVGSVLTADVSGVDARVFLLKMGGLAKINSIVISDAKLGANFITPSSYPNRLVELSEVRDFTLRDIALDLNGPAGSDMSLTGIYMEKSDVELTNITVKGNGQANLVGIECALASYASIWNVSVRGCNAGILSTFFSEPRIRDVDISDCTYGVLVDKSGNGTLGTSRISAQTAVRLSDESWINLVDCPLQGGTTDISLNGSSVAWCLNATFNKDHVEFEDDTSMVVVNWYLTLTVRWRSLAGVETDTPIPGAELVLKNRHGDSVLSTVTDESGRVGPFTVPEYTETRLERREFSPYTVEVTYRGFTGEGSVSVTKNTDAVIYVTDDSLPAVTILDPEDGRIQNHTTVLLSGTCSDLGSGLRALSFSLDGESWNETPATPIWSHEMEVPEGEWTLMVRVTDVSGNEGSASVGVLIDLTRPFIEVSSPPDGSLGNKIAVTLEGRVEPGSQLTVNLRPAAVAEDGSFSYPLRLVEGANVYHLFARDRAGNTNSLTWTLNLDITPPILTLTSPPDGLLTRQSSVSVRGVTEPGARLTINGDVAAVAEDGGFSLELSLVSGANQITVAAEDEAGNRATVIRTVQMDNEIHLSVSEPENNTMTNQITILIKGVADTDVALRMNAGLVTLGPDGSFTLTYTLQEGANELVFQAVDPAGNSMSLTRVVTLDTSRPPLVLLEPYEGQLLSARRVTVSGSCEPGMTLRLNGEPVDTAAETFSRELELSEGANTISLEGSDAAGNAVGIRVTVFVDTVAPALEVVEPMEGFRTNELSVTVSGLSEPGARVSVNGAPVVVDAEGRFSTTQTLRRGSNTITVTASDEAGNTETKSVTLKVVERPAAIVEETGWVWTASGLLIALGIMIPLTTLFITIGLKMRRRSMGGA